MTGDSGLQTQEENGFKRENEEGILERDRKWVESSEKMTGGQWGTSQKSVILSKEGGVVKKPGRFPWWGLKDECSQANSDDQEKEEKKEGHSL